MNRDGSKGVRFTTHNAEDATPSISSDMKYGVNTNKNLCCLLLLLASPSHDSTDCQTRHEQRHWLRHWATLYIKPPGKPFVSRQSFGIEICGRDQGNRDPGYGRTVDTLSPGLVIEVPIGIAERVKRRLIVAGNVAVHIGFSIRYWPPMRNIGRCSKETL